MQVASNGPAISVLIRTIGRKPALADALESLRRQTFRDFEVMLVEDGPASLDDFLRDYSDLTFCYQALGTRQGRSAAGNHALALAQGEYLIFLDEDDAFYPEHLQRLHEKITNGAHKIAYSWSQERRVSRDESGSIRRRGNVRRWRRETFSLLQLIACNFIPINAVLFARSLYESAGGFDPDLEYLEDWMLWLRYAAIEPDWQCVPYATAVYHVPFARENRARAGEFRTVHATIRDRLRQIRIGWKMDGLKNDLERHFGKAVFLRRLYYYFTSYLPL